MSENHSITSILKFQELIPVKPKSIGKEEINAVDARDLHGFLKLRENFNEWIKRYLSEYGFVINSDFCKFSQIASNGRKTENYYLSIDMAKEISIISKTERGREARKYFIAHAKTQNNFIKDMMQAVNDIDLGDIPEDGYKRYVYVAKEEISGRIKIGISKDPRERIKALNTGNPEELILVAQFEAKKKGYQSEKDAHSLLKEHKIRSEWFDKDTDYTLISKVA